MTRGQQDIALILVRDLAEKLVAPMFLTDADGKIVFFNEAAESILGREYSDRYSIGPQDWTTLLQPEDLEGRKLELHEVPPGKAFLEKVPAHGRLRITGLDGVRRLVSATAFPLLTRGDHFVGMLSIFWEELDPNA
jgi:PAS domain S-box-containing protein